MLKRFYSKKSGFTLVEIVIAFAIFAIMAAMICQILDLSVSARQSNNRYQQELAEQQKLLTLINKNSGDFKSEDGKMVIKFTDGTSAELKYDMISAKENAEFDSEGLNYFIAPVNYGGSGELSPGVSAGGDAGSGTSTGSQASRMDTRLTGTGGIGYVRISEVIKDTHTYAAGDPNAVPTGYTRFFISTSASSQLPDTDDGKAGDETLQSEDVPFSQYRIYFRDDNVLGAGSNIEYTEGSKTYTKDVYASFEISKMGYLTKDPALIADTGLTSDNWSTVRDKNTNKYTIDLMGTDTIRIGTPFESGGIKFNSSVYSNFFIEVKNFMVPSESDPSVLVEQEPSITINSFGYNGFDSSYGSTFLGRDYAACPMYADKYNDNGTPKYTEASNKPHVNIFGAYLYTRHYVESAS